MLPSVMLARNRRGADRRGDVLARRLREPTVDMRRSRASLFAYAERHEPERNDMTRVVAPCSVCAWLKEKALPLWSSVGWDRDTDSFVERLSSRGEPLLDTPRRAMVQARQIYAFGTAHRNGWLSDSEDLVSRAADSMVRRYYGVDGARGWAFSVARDGAVVDSRRDLYTHAFVLLGLATAYETTQDRAYIALADKTLDFLDGYMASAHGGYIETLPDSRGHRRQNPHMHLLEALLALFDATKRSSYFERATAVRDLFFARFLQSQGSVVVEFFDNEWRPLDSPHFPFEPGHHFEWIWLLDRYEKLQRFDLANALDRLWDTALHVGVDSNCEIFARGTIGGAVDRSTRLWFYTEAAKAALVMSARQERFCGPTAKDFLDAMHERFLEPALSGSWIDEFDAHGCVKNDFAPASSLYHICCAVDASESAGAPPWRR